VHLALIEEEQKQEEWNLEPRCCTWIADIIANYYEEESCAMQDGRSG